MDTAPLVSVVVAVHNGEPYLRVALESVLRQTVPDLELVVIDDGSTDGTSEVLAGFAGPGVRVLRNDEQQGLAGSLNRGLDDARGRYVARMDADDVAFPHWLDRCLRLLAADRQLGLVGAGVLDIGTEGRPGRLHVHEGGRAALRWRSLFGSPVFHNTVVVDRDLLEANGLRYDTSFGESEDYDLWCRVLEVTEGDVVEEPLVLHRLHPQQASRRRGVLQQTLADEISARQISTLAPGWPTERATAVRRLGTGARLPADALETAADGYLELLDRFEAAHEYSGSELDPVRQAAARSLGRAARWAGDGAGRRLLREAARLDPALPVHVAARRVRRARESRAAKEEAARWLRELSASPLSTAPADPAVPPVPAVIRVAAVFPEPTPYRAPLLDRVADLPEIDLTVIYAAETVAGRTWRVEPRHRAVFLVGARLPGARAILHHDYPLTPGIARALSRARPDVVVVSGWSTFAAQLAIGWCRTRGVPYVLVVESHDAGPRSGWRRRVKGTVVPRVVRGASGALVTGTLARQSMIARGAAPERVRIFANTIDVEEFGREADRIVERRVTLREELGAGSDDVVVLSVARLAPEKGLDVLVHALAEAGDPRLLLALAGSGPERERLADLAHVRGVRLVFVGERPWDRIVETYVTADVFALLSQREPWAVVVNEAAACGLPLVLSDRVGAAHDLLLDGENGVLVEAGDVGAAAAAFRRLAADPVLRRAYGERSRELARDWGYGPSVDGFLAAVREAVSEAQRTDGAGDKRGRPERTRP